MAGPPQLLRGHLPDVRALEAVEYVETRTRMRIARICLNLLKTLGGAHHETLQKFGLWAALLLLEFYLVRVLRARYH